MSEKRIHIAIIEPSEIVYEGLSNLLLKSGKHFQLFRLNETDELVGLSMNNIVNFVIINPILIQNNLNEFIKLKHSYNEIKWIALVYSFFDNRILNAFDDKISITDSIDIVYKKLDTIFYNLGKIDNRQEYLTEREIDVLKELVKGFSNKEIADKLNISAHTVISHRKNIIEKTGIRTLPGLTIYAISKKIVSLDFSPF